MSSPHDAVTERPVAFEAADAQGLSVHHVSLHHFRNHVGTSIDVDSAPVVLTGRNGAGKTNILEAVSLLCPGRGLRRAKLSQMDCQKTGQPWVVSARVMGIEGHVQIGTGRVNDASSHNDKRAVRVDGITLKSQADLAQHLSMIWLTPQMEQLFHESASAGRKFLDRLVMGFDPQQASLLNQYELTMRERNKLLQMPRPDAAWLSALEERMAACGIAIALARRDTIEHVNTAIQQSHLSFPKAVLSTRGETEEILTQMSSAVEGEERYARALCESRGRDAASGRALFGVHRSDLEVLHLEKQMLAQFCSTGEQKALLLSVVLAQVRASMQWRSIIPVLLLDEVVAHLDSTRRLELFGEICHIGAQTWMTGTDPVLFEGMQKKATFFQIENGAVLSKG